MSRHYGTFAGHDTYQGLRILVIILSGSVLFLDTFYSIVSTTSSHLLRPTLSLLRSFLHPLSCHPESQATVISSPKLTSVMIQTDTLVGCVVLAILALTILMIFVRDTARHPPGPPSTTHGADAVALILAMEEGARGFLNQEPLRGYWNIILGWIVPPTTDGPRPILHRQDPATAVPAPTAPWNTR
ncbi:hypothetical protein M407DRAFT_32091 [Tulasnella calospora MUT 4182]|uniref:Uncharacterized protein n=1 Tax=Tulasnella calospora MUT 4182 TaxID=1051891 RepID=A0A0C3L9S8_9AGAM|nr:hypothetical protein M407DRAFT_32091 [Tulasnella calospora MUT 4182]